MTKTDYYISNPEIATKIWKRSMNERKKKQVHKWNVLQDARCWCEACDGKPHIIPSDVVEKLFNEYERLKIKKEKEKENFKPIHGAKT